MVVREDIECKLEKCKTIFTPKSSRHEYCSADCRLANKKSLDQASVEKRKEQEKEFDNSEKNKNPIDPKFLVRGKIYNFKRYWGA